MVPVFVVCTAAAVISAVPGEHTAAGSAITKVAQLTHSASWVVASKLEPILCHEAPIKRGIPVVGSTPPLIIPFAPT